MPPSRLATLPLLAACLLPLPAQSQAPADQPQIYPQAAHEHEEDPTGNTVAQDKEWAWDILTSTVNDRKHTDTRIQALAALGFLGNNPRSIKLILDCLDDSDVEIRAAAVLAAGQSKSPDVTTDLHRMLDDKEPQVAYAAATTLWKMNDHSGEDILIAVVDGERSANPGLVKGATHTMARDLHHPSTLARLGALQGAGMLLGPFGMGITALEYMRKNGNDLSRVTAVEQVAENHTGPIRARLLAALADKDAAVRVAATKALATYHDPEVAIALANEFPDGRPPVRLTAAAAYLVNTGYATMPSNPPSKAHAHKRPEPHANE